MIKINIYNGKTTISNRMRMYSLMMMINRNNLVDK